MEKYKKIIPLAVLVSVLICLGAFFSVRHDEESSKESGKRRLVIIDTDTGADDAAAIILAAKNPDIDILGVTVLLGNVDLEQSTKNALMALEAAGCKAPVYKGAAETFAGKKREAFSVFGTDGMGDADLIHPKGRAEDGDAVDFIIDTVKKYPGEVEIISIGPATNIARAIEKDPDAMKEVRMIWSMGTAGLGEGNASPVAEFNVYSDPHAYKKMLDSGLPITIAGLDMCGGEAMWTDENFEQLEKTGKLGSFISKSFGKIRKFYADNGQAGTVMNCDPLVVACMVYSDFCQETIKCYGSCITEEGETYGQVIFYREGFTYDYMNPEGVDYNVTLVTKVDAPGYFQRYLNAIK